MNVVLSLDVSISSLCVHVLGHVCIQLVCESDMNVNEKEAPCACAHVNAGLSVCSCLRLCTFIHVCSFMCACPPGSIGVLSGNTKPPPLLSDLAGTVSWSQQLAATSAVQHGKKKRSAPLIFYSLPAGRHHVDLAMLALSP